MPVFRSFTFAGALLAATLLPAPAAAAGVSVRTLAAQEAQLSTIAYRMAAVNAAACREPEIMTGLILHDLTQYSREQRAAAAHAFSLRGGVGILQFVPGSAAARAGLQIDDEIIAVDNYGVEEPHAVARSAKSFRRMDRFLALLQTRLRAGPVQLLVRRRGQLHQVRLAGEPGCGGALTLSSSTALNAWADGKHVVLTRGMSDFARDPDEIAFVIGHEMAHNILGHSHKTAAHGIFGAKAARSRSYELDADRYAIQLMSAAGYRADAGVSLLQRVSRRLWWAFSLSHPGFGERINVVSRAIAGLGTRNASHRLAKADVAAPSQAALTAPRALSGPTEAATFHRAAAQGTRAFQPGLLGQATSREAAGFRGGQPN